MRRISETVQDNNINNNNNNGLFGVAAKKLDWYNEYRTVNNKL